MKFLSNKDYANLSGSTQTAHTLLNFTEKKNEEKKLLLVPLDVIYSVFALNESERERERERKRRVITGNNCFAKK